LRTQVINFLRLQLNWFARVNVRETKSDFHILTHI